MGSMRRIATALWAMSWLAGPTLAQNVPNSTDLNTLDLTVRYRVRAVYFAPSDRPFPPGIRERLDTWVRLARNFFREEMALHGHLNSAGRGKTFVIDQTGDGLWNVVFMAGQHPASYYQGFESPADPWAVGGACLAEMYNRLPYDFHARNVTLYLFDTYTVDNENFRYTCNGGSGAEWEGEGTGYVIQGTHFLGPGFNTVALTLADQPALFFQEGLSPIRDWRWDGTRDLISRAELTSIYVGVPIHELGHAFSLGHVFEPPGNLMGGGFRYFGGRFGQPVASDHPTCLDADSAAFLDTEIMFNQPDPFDISASTHPLVWR